MINHNFINKLKDGYQGHEKERRQIISASNEILYLSKKTIFSIHRDNLTEAKNNLEIINKKLEDIQKRFGWTRAYEEGAFSAAMEEFVEAQMFLMAVEGKIIQPIPKTKLNQVSYLGGLCDMTGELVRLATNQAAKKNWKEVERVKGIIDETMAALLEFDLGGYLRTKYDQARGNLRKIEQISYEIALKTDR
jgi:predicted translin family RNA/ssDNA-binding protein